jgi:hypothetical protein
MYLFFLLRTRNSEKKKYYLLRIQSIFTPCLLPDIFTTAKVSLGIDGVFKPLGINFDFKDDLNRQINIEIRVKYENKKEFHQN